MWFDFFLKTLIFFFKTMCLYTKTRDFYLWAVQLWLNGEKKKIRLKIFENTFLLSLTLRMWNSNLRIFFGGNSSN